MNEERIEVLDNEPDPESIDPTQRGDDMLSEIEEGSELYEHIRMTVDPGQQPERIDTFLTSHISNISRNRVQNAAKAGNILVNDKVVKSNYKVKPNDVISIVFSYPPRETDIKPEPIPLNIVYEDDDIIVINKQAGLVASKCGKPHRLSRPPHRQGHHRTDDCSQKRDCPSCPGQAILRPLHPPPL